MYLVLFPPNISNMTPHTAQYSYHALRLQLHSAVFDSITCGVFLQYDALHLPSQLYKPVVYFYLYPLGACPTGMAEE